MNRPFLIAVLSIALILPIGACRHENAEGIDEETAPPRLVVGSVSHNEDESPAPAGDIVTSDTDGTVNQSPTEPEAAEEAFPLPYPERTDIFEEPDENLVSRPDLQDEYDIADLRLKGFVDINGQQALVMWNGRIRAVSEGDQLGDVQIIEITPPEIRFQRGRVRWVESLTYYGG